MSDTAAPVGVVGRRRKDVLPSPLAGGIDVLANKRIGERRAPKAMAEILPVLAADSFEVIEQLLLAGRRQHGHAVLASLAITHHDLQALEVDVLDPHVESLEQPQSGTVEQPADEQHDAVELGEETAYFFVGQDDRQPPRALSADDAAQLTNLSLEHHLVEEQQGIERLVLRRGAEAARRPPGARGRR